MKLRTILVDDEPLALERLQRMLQSYDDFIEVVGIARNGADAVAVINDLRPDVIFLDVQMPELSGFDVLERLDYIPLVIFTTAYDQYALRAFDVYSVDYLLKPIDPGRLKTALDKLTRLINTETSDMRERVRGVRETLQDPHRRRIQVKTGDKIRLVPVADVVYFLASEKYVEVHTHSGSHLITQSLSRLEAELPPGELARVHRSAIVNINFIDEITKTFGGAYEVRMKDEKKTRLPVSRRYRARLDLG